MRISAVSALYLLFLSLVLSHCAYAESLQTTNTINVQLKWRHQFQFAGYYIAKEKGYYRQYGLDVNLLERTTSTSPIEKLSYGDVDYAIGNVDAIVYRANGTPLVALAAFFQHSSVMLISRFPNLNQLTNKKVMVTKGAMNAEIMAMFRKNKISTNDIQFIQSKQAITEFISGNVDAYSVYASNEMYQLQNAKINFYPFYPIDYNIDFYGDILLTLENTLKSNPEEVAHFKEATIKGWEYAITHIDETIEIILTQYPSTNKTKEELAFEARHLIQYMYSDIIPIGYMNSERWQAIEKELRILGILKGPQVDFERFIYSPPKELNAWETIWHLKVQISAVVIILFSLALLFHNRRLKIKVKEHTQLIEHERIKAEIDARTDALTQLANRRKFMESIEHDLSIARRNNLDFSVVYLDIDLFKSINDTYGHAAGDNILKELANILKNNTRPSDNIARIGGEEFAITSLGKNTHTAAALADRIRQKVEEHTFFIDKIEIKITISMGVASLTDTQTSDELLKCTDDALYKAKNSGRNQVQIASTG
ncbi:diguanylate cyclase [Thalassotalea piscium]